jgi:hypothetical protein
MIYNFEKKIGGGSLCTGGAAGFGPCTFLVPPILVPPSYQKLIHSHESGTIFNFSPISIYIVLKLKLRQGISLIRFDKFLYIFKMIPSFA